MKKLLAKAGLIGVTLIFGAISCTTPEATWRSAAENPEFLHRSIKQITDVIVHDIFSPPVASRIYTYATVAGYEAAIRNQPNYVSLAGQLQGLDSIPDPESGKEYCFALASVQATLMVGRTLVFSEDKMDEFYNRIMQQFKDTGMPDEVFDNSIAYGNKVKDRIMKWSGKDNYKQSRSFPKYTVVSDPATWKPTPPAYMDAIEPHWNKIRTFTMDSAAQFKPAAPPAFSVDKKSEFYKYALEVYNVGKELTPEQKNISMFWDCNPFVMNVKGHVMFATKKISPGGHWMGITRVACVKTNAGYVQSAEAYTRVALSLMDGFISCWDEKYRSRLIRPETYINQYIDENWTPLLQTPPFPEYTSGHSVISTSAAVALTKLFGDNFAFTDSTEIEFGLTARSFTSFNQAAEEAARSRVYGGIHYAPAAENGKKQGRALGEFIVNKIKTRKENLAQGKL
jgi:hypothetical protein